MSPYLDTTEAAGLAGTSPRTMLRRVEMYQVPALRLNGTLIRIEAIALDPTAPPPIPAVVPIEITIPWLAELWRVDGETLQQLARRGALPMFRRGGNGAWVMRRSRFYRFVVENTHGEGGW